MWRGPLGLLSRESSRLFSVLRLFGIAPLLGRLEQPASRGFGATGEGTTSRAKPRRLSAQQAWRPAPQAIAVPSLGSSSFHDLRKARPRHSPSNLTFTFYPRQGSTANDYSPDLLALCLGLLLEYLKLQGRAGLRQIENLKVRFDAVYFLQCHVARLSPL